MSPLQFWYNNRTTFPKVYKIVQQLFSVPATSCDSERYFSTPGLLINDQRSRVGSDFVDHLIPVKSNADKISDLEVLCWKEMV